MNTRNQILLTCSNLSAELKKSISDMGFKPVHSPALEIRHTSGELPELTTYTGLIFTSANGIKALSAKSNITRLIKKIPVYATGSQTAQEADSQGFSNIYMPGANENLASLIKRNKPRGQLLHIRGEHISYPLAQKLNNSNIHTEEHIAYSAVKTSSLSAEAHEAIKQQKIFCTLFFSARAGENFTCKIEESGLQKELKDIKSLSISVRVLKSVCTLPWSGAYASDHPDRSSMLTKLEKLAGEEGKI